MQKPLHVVSLVLLLSFVFSCSEFDKDKKYERPEWLAGKLFTQIQAEPELSTFAKCLQLAGYDSIINTSGSYTVFAPDNAAFDLYFESHPAYHAVEDIPLPEMMRLVKYHVVQNPWSTDQLKSLDVYGWIDSTDINNDEPRGFKRATLLREKDRNYGVTGDNLEDRLIIVDTLSTSWYRKQYTDSRKYAPVFFNEYFSIYDLNAATDYSFYFGRPFDNPADIYFSNGKITTSNIFAENGFIHVIDRVVEPLENAYQIMDASTDHSYKKFLSLVNTFPSFVFNEDRTNDQPGAAQGEVVDSLFDITYPELTFDITSEKTSAPEGTTGLPGNVSIRYHHGLIAPTDAAFDEFVALYLAGPGKWGSIAEAPPSIRRMMVNTNMASGPVYPTDFTRGFINGENDMITVDPSTIVQKEYGSNCTFIGVSKMLVPRAFKSITGPVYIQRGYSRAMNVIESSGLLPSLKRENQNYMLYIESDANLRVDSSLIFIPPNPQYPEGQFYAYLISQGSAQEVGLTTNDLRTLILNHTAIEYPDGNARKEFLKNLAGNYIIVNNQTGEVSGMAHTTYGYKGLDQVNVIPTQISVDADNGLTFDISNWFSFSAPTLFLKISGSYPAFHNLLKQAGLTKDKEYRYTFISENENYTVFVPSAEALAAYRTDTLTTDELRKFLLLHFVQGNMMFTDGKMSGGYYETTRVDEKSTTYTTIYTKIHIEPGTDVIGFPDKQGADYLTVNESDKTNIIAARATGTGTEAYPMILSNAVIHEVDKVLLFNELDTK